MNLIDELHSIATTLSDAGVAYAVCGGIAVTVYGATRSTKDIDVRIAPKDLPRVLDLVRPLGYVFAAFPLILDILLAAASFSSCLDDRVRIDLPEGPLWVVSRAPLLRMKRMAGRPQDLADVEKLDARDE